MSIIRRVVAGGCLVLVALTTVYSEEIKAESNTFTFPPITAVSAKSVLPQASFFRHTGGRPLSRSITFSWSFPGSVSEKTGTITVYSLLGRVVAQLPVQKNSGTATWHVAPTLSRNGLFIARMSYGTTVKNLKLMLWN